MRTGHRLCVALHRPDSAAIQWTGISPGPSIWRFLGMEAIKSPRAYSRLILAGGDAQDLALCVERHQLERTIRQYLDAISRLAVGDFGPRPHDLPVLHRRHRRVDHLPQGYLRLPQRRA